jgi:PPOX class probable F420-dependent enzyme
MELTVALEMARGRNQGILATASPDGRPHLSNILYSLTRDPATGESAEISITDDRVKTRNIRHDPRVALHVGGDSFWEYVVLEARAELSPVAASTHDQTVEGLVAMYRRIQGEHDDWDEFRQAMVDQRRILLRLRPERAYGIVRS